MNISKRQFIQGLGAAAAVSIFGTTAGAVSQRRYDLLIIGAGTAGMPAAIFAAQRGLSVLAIDAAPTIGGTLMLSSGQLSAAGTRIQKQKGIVDTPQEHFDDLMRISRGTIDQSIARLAVNNAAATLDWLVDNGYENMPDYPVKGVAHEPYSKARYYWSAKRGYGIFEAMQPKFNEAVKTGKVDLLLEHKAVEFQTDRSGNISAVVAQDSSGKRVALQAKNVLLSSGGYASNAKMFEKLARIPKYLNHSYPYSQGEGHLLAESVGGYMRYAEKYITNFGMMLATNQIPSTKLTDSLFHPHLRQPWEIYVNSAGQRFIREDVPSVDARENALRLQPNLRHWVVFDHNILSKAPPILKDWTRERMLDAFKNQQPNFFTGDSIEALAKAAQLPAEALTQTVEAFNYGVITGNDFFGRKHMPAKIEKGPFYALRHQGTSITSTAGIAVNDKLQVVRRDGKAIANLYAAGEILGAGATQGQAFCGGMMVTPALTFGRLLGSRLITV